MRLCKLFLLVRAIRVDGKTYQDRDYPLQGEKEMARP